MTAAKPISSFASRALLSSLLSLLWLTTGAQERKMVALSKPDSVALFRGVAVSADLVGAAQLGLSDYGQFEGAVRVNLKDKYFPVFEAGLGKADTEDENTKIR
ncbi:MAG TPA: hypothetical protein VIQ97_00215, partial [Prevotella sp.]